MFEANATWRRAASHLDARTTPTDFRVRLKITYVYLMPGGARWASSAIKNTVYMKKLIKATLQILAENLLYMSLKWLD